MNERVADRPTTRNKGIRDRVAGDPSGKRWTLKIAFKKTPATTRC
jgi:hypothetical protein